MIRSHPTEAMLHSYVTGDLNSASALVVSSHLDMCTHCQRVVSAIENDLSDEVLAEEESFLGDFDMQFMLDAIFNSEDIEGGPLSAATSNDGLIYLEGRRFQLPRSLARQQARIGPWDKMIGNMWRAAIRLGTDEVANLIYMDRSTSLPEHTHKGTELQLILKGSFTDEYGTYQPGDLVMLDATHQHTPQTPDEDCLILAVLDGPLHFTSGISRLLNQFSSLFFR